MSSLLANRRKARKVGTDEDDDAQNGSEQGLYSPFDLTRLYEVREDLNGLTLRKSRASHPETEHETETKIKIAPLIWTRGHFYGRC